jgi:predicted phage tail protein
MTEVHLHGILAKKYGKVHRIALKKPRDVLFAMEANYDDFLKDLKDLMRKNIFYTFVINGKMLDKPEAGSLNKKIQKLDLVPVLSGGGIDPVTIALVVISVASAVYSYVQAGKVEYPKLPGASATTSANSRSLAFSNRENITEQGNPVPLVYGRLKVGSAVIQSSIKSFPLSISLSQEFQNTSARNSANQNATIDNSLVDDNNVQSN